MRRLLIALLLMATLGSAHAEPVAVPAPAPSPAPTPAASPVAPPNVSPTASPVASPEASPAASPEASPAAPREEGTGYTSRPRLVGALTLQQAVDIALARSLRAGMAREDALMATAERMAAASQLGLQVSGTAIVASENTPMIYPTAPGVMPAFYARLADRPSADFNLMAMLPIFTGGRLQALLAGAKANEKAALARQAWELLDVAREARISYARVLLAREKLEVASWQVAQQTENLDLVNKLHDVGKAARYLTLRARAELANARQAENAARAGLTADEAALKVVLGIDMASQLEYADSLAVVDAASSAEPADVMKAALAERPDLAAARLDVASAAQAVRGARARYAPALYATGMLEGMQEWGGGRSSMWGGGYSLGAVLSVPIFDSGERRAEVLASQARQRRRELQVQDLELEVTRQVTEARASYVAARDNVALADDEVARATEDLRVARLRFKLGRAIHLEVVDGLAAVARARLNRLTALFEANVAAADLLRATGKLGR